MKIVFALCMALGIATAAAAKPAPFSWQPRSVTAAIDPRHVAAMMEADYFRAPQVPAVEPAKGFPCRLQLFDKTRIARSCN